MIRRYNVQTIAIKDGEDYEFENGARIVHVLADHGSTRTHRVLTVLTELDIKL